MKKIFSLFILIPLLSIVLTACSDNSSSDKDESDTKNNEQKVIKVATNIPYSPFEFEENGKLTGFDIEVIQAIGKELNWKVDIQNEEFDSIFTKINDGAYDMGIAAISINEERTKTNDFSDPYFTSYQLIITDNNPAITEIKDLIGKKVAVQDGTTGHELVKRELGETDSNIVIYGDTEEGINAFIIGEVDAFVADNSFILDYLKTSDSKEYALVKDNGVEYEQFGIVIKKGDKELQKDINEGIRIIQENGVYDTIYNKYFGN